MIFVTAEMWPTNVRTTIMNTCLMFGRIGSALAPFTVILVSEILIDFMKFGQEII